MPTRAQWGLQALGLLAILVACVVVVIPATATDLRARAGCLIQRYDWGTDQGDVAVKEAYLPIDLTWRPTPGLRMRAGADYAAASHSGLSTTESVGSPGEVRLGIDSSVMDGRARFGFGVRLPTAPEGMEPGEERVAEALESLTLDLPWSRFAAGTRISVQGALQVLRRKRLQVQTGLGYENRNDYRLVEMGPIYDPADLWRLGMSGQTVSGAWLHRFGAQVAIPGESRIGQFPIDSGAEFRFEAGSNWLRDGQPLSVDLILLFRNSGSADPSAPIRSESLRGGNTSALRVAETRRFGVWDVQGSLSGVVVRGFAGDLGRAAWIAPALGISRELASGRFGVRGQLTWGQVRSGRNLTGVSLSVAWDGRLIW